LRGRVVARRTACMGEDVAGVGCRAQDTRRSRREEGSRSAQIGRTVARPNQGACDASVHRSCERVRLEQTSRSLTRTAYYRVRLPSRPSADFQPHRRRG
jgi:hypothetical protein